MSFSPLFLIEGIDSMNNGLVTRKKIIESIKKQNDSLKELSLKLSKISEINK